MFYFHKSRLLLRRMAFLGFILLAHYEAHAAELQAARSRSGGGGGRIGNFSGNRAEIRSGNYRTSQARGTPKAQKNSRATYRITQNTSKRPSGSTYRPSRHALRKSELGPKRNITTIDRRPLTKRVTAKTQQQIQANKGTQASRKKAFTPSRINSKQQLTTKTGRVIISSGIAGRHFAGNRQFARNVGVALGAGTALGISLAYSNRYFCNPYRHGAFWGTYNIFTFGWGPAWFYPRCGLWFSPWSYTWYYPWFRCWYFPFDYAWYYPTFGYYVRLYQDEPSTYLTIENDEDKNLYFAVYEKQKTTSGSIIFYQTETPRQIRRLSNSRLYLKDRDPGEIIIISRQKKNLKAELHDAEAQNYSIVQLDTLQQQQEISEVPQDALRINSLDNEAKIKLRNAITEMDKRDVSSLTNGSTAEADIVDLDNNQEHNFDADND